MARTSAISRTSLGIYASQQRSGLLSLPGDLNWLPTQPEPRLVLSVSAERVIHNVQRVPFSYCDTGLGETSKNGLLYNGIKQHPTLLSQPADGLPTPVPSTCSTPKNSLPFKANTPDGSLVRKRCPLICNQKYPRPTLKTGCCSG
jgi:hypothetical protein